MIVVGHCTNDSAAIFCCADREGAGGGAVARLAWHAGPASGTAKSWANVWTLAKFFLANNVDSGLYPAAAICPDASFAWTWGSAGDANGYYVTLSYGMNTDQLNQGTPMSALFTDSADV